MKKQELTKKIVKADKARKEQIISAKKHNEEKNI